MPAETGHQVIARAAQVLRCIEKDHSGLTIAQITRSTELPRSTVTRLVNSLAAEGFVEVISGSVRLGPELSRMANAVRFDTLDSLRPALRKLAAELCETVHVWREREDCIELIEAFESEQEVRIVAEPGTQLPLHTTSAGKAFLAQYSDQQVATRMDGKLSKNTSRSITSIEDLITELHRYAEKGIAIDDEEHAEGVCAIGSYVDLKYGEKLAVAIAAPTARFRQHQETMMNALRDFINSVASGE